MTEIVVCEPRLLRPRDRIQLSEDFPSDYWPQVKQTDTKIGGVLVMVAGTKYPLYISHECLVRAVWGDWPLDDRRDPNVEATT
jgi:hypothetical protein